MSTSNTDVIRMMATISLMQLHECYNYRINHAAHTLFASRYRTISIFTPSNRTKNVLFIKMCLKTETQFSYFIKQFSKILFFNLLPHDPTINVRLLQQCKLTYEVIQLIIQNELESSICKRIGNCSNLGRTPSSLSSPNQKKVQFISEKFVYIYIDYKQGSEQATYFFLLYLNI